MAAILQIGKGHNIQNPWRKYFFKVILTSTYCFKREGERERIRASLEMSSARHCDLVGGGVVAEPEDPPPPPPPCSRASLFRRICGVQIEIVRLIMIH